MPIHTGTDHKGYYYQWGNQKKCYYNQSSEISRTRAHNRCVKQAKAIYSQQKKNK